MMILGKDLSSWARQPVIPLLTIKRISSILERNTCMEAYQYHIMKSKTCWFESPWLSKEVRIAFCKDTM